MWIPLRTDYDCSYQNPNEARKKQIYQINEPMCNCLMVISDARGLYHFKPIEIFAQLYAVRSGVFLLNQKRFFKIQTPDHVRRQLFAFNEILWYETRRTATRVPVSQFKALRT